MPLKPFDNFMPYEEMEKEADVLVFLHGYPNNHLLWQPQVTSLGTDYHILNFSLPGSLDGKVFPKEYYSPEFIAQTIGSKMKAILQQRPRKRFILVGHDLGCFILHELTKLFPSEVRGQIFISGMGLPHYASRIGMGRQWLKSWYIWPLVLPGGPTLVRKKLKYPLARLIKEADGPEGFTPIEIYRRLAASIPKALASRSAEPMATPTLFIFGKQDPFLVPPTLAEARRFHQHCQVTLLDGGHWIGRDRPEAVTEAIKKFLVLSSAPEQQI